MVAAGQNLKRLVKKKRQDFLGNTPENAHQRSARFLFVGEQIMKKLAGFHFGPTFSWYQAGILCD
jgi:hypothetical protein